MAARATKRVNLGSHLLQRVLQLPPPSTRDLVVEHHRVPMPDGLDLLADRWAPRGSGTGGGPEGQGGGRNTVDGLPVALIRTPYGRRGAMGTMLARPLAERGFQVLLQSTRGTFGSGNDFDPMRREREDGLATLDWVVRQPWFGGGAPCTKEAWRDFDSWPPLGYPAQRFHLRPGGALSLEPPGESAPDRYRYDPADPTPAVGGVRLSGKAGRVDNTALEARPDVLTYTTPELDRDLEVIGEVSAEIWFRSSAPHADVFVRLCDVDARGRSYNVCDGLVSLSAADQISCAKIQLWPTAHRFRRGHRIRVQVGSGAFPRYARNPGTGEPRATAVTFRAADQQVFHGPSHPSAILLPVRQEE